MKKTFDQVLMEQQSELNWTKVQKAQVNKLEDEGWTLSESDDKGNPVVQKEASQYKFIIQHDGSFEAVDSGE